MVFLPKYGIEWNHEVMKIKTAASSPVFQRCVGCQKTLKNKEWLTDGTNRTDSTGGYNVHFLFSAACHASHDRMLETLDGGQNPGAFASKANVRTSLDTCFCKLSTNKTPPRKNPTNSFFLSKWANKWQQACTSKKIYKIKQHPQMAVERRKKNFIFIFKTLQIMNFMFILQESVC